MTSPTLDLRSELTHVVDRLEVISGRMHLSSFRISGLSDLDGEISHLHDLLDTLNAQDGRDGPLPT